MGAPQKNQEVRRFEAIRNYFREYFEDIRIAYAEIGNAMNALFMENVDDYNDVSTKQAVEEAVKETIKENPEMANELDKIQEAITYQQDRLENMNTSKEQEEKDEDGYHKIPDKVSRSIKAEVSEEQAHAQTNNRPKDGRQKTRVDED